MITEAGWTTNSNIGWGINAQHVNELQKIHYDDPDEWTAAERIVTFVFEASTNRGKDRPTQWNPKSIGVYLEWTAPLKW